MRFSVLLLLPTTTVSVRLLSCSTLKRVEPDVKLCSIESKDTTSISTQKLRLDLLRQVHRLSCQLLTLSPAGHRNWLNEPCTILPRDLVGAARSCSWLCTDGLHAHTLAGCFSAQLGTSQGEAALFFTRTPSYPQDMVSTACPLWSTWRTLHCPGTRPARDPGPAKLHRRYSLWCRAGNPARTRPDA